MADGLAQACEMAKTLAMPLLLTGDPGVGKSSLARALAEREGLTLFEVKVHSDTRYQDLFYNFDDLGRYSEASVRDENVSDSGAYQPIPVDLQRTDPRLFIRFVGLGAAILQALPRDESWLQPALRTDEFKQGACRSVVLIDEIDKAPRDVPNDLLVQLEQWRFEVQQFARLRDYPPEGFALENTDKKPLVVITSNREKQLPDAFLRRCVYYHIDLPPTRAANPDAEVTLEDILMNRLKGVAHEGVDAETLLDECVSVFSEVRELPVSRKPGLAELLNWFHYLLMGSKRKNSLSDLQPQEIRQMICSLLLKDSEDHTFLDDFATKPTTDGNATTSISAKFPILSRYLSASK